jgi:hypothetical protein
MRSLLTCAIFTCAVLAAALAVRAETIDRIAVTVGTHVISERDVLQDIRLSAFLDNKPPDFTGANKRAAAARLVDQFLVLEEATLTRSPLASLAEADPLLEPIRARYASDTDYRAALAAARIGEDELKAQLLAGLRMLRYTDTRFRPEIQFSEEALRTYFDNMVSQAKAANPNAPEPKFEDSRDDIEKLLTDQQVMQTMDRWLDMARHDAPVRYREAVFQ